MPRLLSFAPMKLESLKEIDYMDREVKAGLDLGDRCLNQLIYAQRHEVADTAPRTARMPPCDPVCDRHYTS
jgi:hypothetical protein